jgi:hypothetical protein
MGTAFVPDGTIVLGGFIRADGDFSVPVLGGTGTYRGVGGVARVRDIAPDRRAYVFRLTRYRGARHPARWRRRRSGPCEKREEAAPGRRGRLRGKASTDSTPIGSR